MTGDFTYCIRARCVDIFQAGVQDFAEEAPSTFMVQKMRLKQAVFAAAAAVTSLVNAQQTAWGQCGGQGIVYSSHLTELMYADKGAGWSGPTSCISGYVCTYLNNWHSTFPQNRSLSPY